MTHTIILHIKYFLEQIKSEINRDIDFPLFPAYFL